METHFLGWERPALHLAVEFFWERVAAETDWDLSAVLVVLPSARAGRRLVELLALKALESPSGVWFKPPQVVTPAQLAGELLTLNQPIACAVESRLAWVRALKQTPAPDLKKLLGRVPAADDLAGWFRLAADIQQLESELAGEDVSFHQVLEACRSRNLDLSVQRWELLQRACETYHQVLADAGLSEKYRVQSEAADVPTGKTIVLLGTVDLPKVTRLLLGRVQGMVIALIHAPTGTPGFDGLGWLEAAHWQDVTVPLTNEQFEIVNFPADQVSLVAKWRNELSEVGPEHISIALGDETLGPQMERGLELAGIQARFGPQRRANHTAPFQFLELLAEWREGGKPEAFAALIRHAEVDFWLAKGEATGPIRPGGWPHVSDLILNEHFPAAVRRGTTQLERLNFAVEKLTAYLDEIDSGPRTLADWSGILTDLLHAFYPPRKSGERREVTQALEALYKVLDDIAMVPPAGPLSESTDFSGAVGVLLEMAGEKEILTPEAEEVIEMTGWLEAHFDDAPVLFVTGFNEGLIPKSETVAPFLPDGLRAELGLPDNRRRYARDAYFLTAILQSRPLVRLLCARFTPENDGLAPSRLLFACGAQDVASRVQQFYDEVDTSPIPGPTLAYGEKEPLGIFAALKPPEEPLRSLRVTAFRDYLACPYRFYLKHILYLSSVEDGSLELQADVFGTLLHDVLTAYGNERREHHGGTLNADAENCADFLVAKLKELAEKQFSKPALPAIGFQLRRLEQRLKAFAEFEAKRASEGWRIHLVEETGRGKVVLEGIGYEFYGRVDRIDVSPDGTYRIIDYKSGESGKKPEELHRVKVDGEKVWKDLQLPLYRRMAPFWGIPEDRVEVGYIVLPKDLEAVQWHAATWTEEEFQQAYGVADWVLQQVGANVFWPPSGDIPRFDDGLSGLCRDSAANRDWLISQPAGPILEWTIRSKTKPGEGENGG